MFVKKWYQCCSPQIFLSAARIQSRRTSNTVHFSQFSMIERNLSTLKKTKKKSRVSIGRKKLDIMKNRVFEGERRWVSFQYEPPMTEEEEMFDEEENAQTKSKNQLKSNQIRLDKLISDNLKLSREYVTFLLENQYCKLVPANVNYAPEAKEPPADDSFIIKRNITRNLRKRDTIYVFLQQRHDEQQLSAQQQEETEDYLEPEFKITKDIILYEDEHVIAVNKPHGYAVHASASHPPHKTVLYSIRDYVKNSAKKRTLLPTFVSLVHRLDKGTSGVLICGKNSHSIQHLSRQLMEKTVDTETTNKKHSTKKLYCAICAISRVDKFVQLLKPTSDEFGMTKNEDEDDELFDPSDFIIEDSSGNRRTLTMEDLKQAVGLQSMVEDMEELREDEEELGEEDFENEELEEEEKLETEEDLERAIAREERKQDELIQSIIDRSIQKEAEQKIDRNQIIVIEKPITAIHLPNEKNKLSIVRKAISPEDELLYQKEMKQSKKARSVIRVVEVNPKKQLALVMVNIKSGRTHQIRSHLASIGAPVLGDYQYYDLLDNRIVYSIDRKIKPTRTMLHCMYMRFLHPFETKAVNCFAPVQGDMLALIKKYFSQETVEEVTGQLSQESYNALLNLSKLKSA
jgi:23S rRNA-/tRNA-specific pseudouridylate synthase